MEGYVRANAAWLRRRTETQQSNAPRIRNGSGSNEGSASTLGGAAHQGFYAMVTKGTDSRRHLWLAEQLIMQDESRSPAGSFALLSDSAQLTGPTEEDCEKALHHLNKYLGQNAINVRAKVVQRRAMGLLERHRLGATTTRRIEGFSRRLGISEIDTWSIMADLDSRGNAHSIEFSAFKEYWKQRGQLDEQLAQPPRRLSQIRTAGDPTVTDDQELRQMIEVSAIDSTSLLCIVQPYAHIDDVLCECLEI